MTDSSIEHVGGALSVFSRSSVAVDELYASLTVAECIFPFDKITIALSKFIRKRGDKKEDQNVFLNPLCDYSIVDVLRREAIFGFIDKASVLLIRKILGKDGPNFLGIIGVMRIFFVKGKGVFFNRFLIFLFVRTPVSNRIHSLPSSPDLSSV